MAISMRMATLMQLHREETYVIPSPTKELVIRAESARRTLVSLKVSFGQPCEADKFVAVDATQPGQSAFGATGPRAAVGERHHGVAPQ